ncbi:Enzymatic polyprotein [Artemisia annua]|uniref:RNA-directed DNA polymerase n=1 Tax=Artemisia annua TaxID=35608 RepID=A0A2U1PM36_ARTAN|nr:Enzymatic polyprotein [Artemisia annua]
MNRNKKFKGNPNATFIMVTIENKKTFAYIDTGATMCFGKRKILKKWEKLEKPQRIIVADKSVHEIWYVSRMVSIYVDNVEFIAPTIYMHDSAFSCPSQKHYEWNVLPFGLKQAPSIYQRFMDNNLDTWAGCLKAIQNGKQLLGLDIDGNPIPQTNSDIQTSELAHSSNDKSVNSEIHTSVLKTEKYKSKLCKYISGTFSQAEQKYSTHEKETLACLRTIKNWKIDLLQTRFELRTDSKYVTGFWRYKLHEDYCRGRLIRWQLQLHQFHPYIKHTHPRMESITKQIKHQLQQKGEQRISLEKQLAIIIKEENELFNSLQFLTQTSSSGSAAESIEKPSPLKPSSSKQSMSGSTRKVTPSTSKTQASYSPQPKKSEFTKMEEDVEEILQQSSIGKQKWYAIFNGPFRGVYRDWAIASSHIVGQNVTHKSYPTKEAAEIALKELYKTVATEEVQKSQRFTSLNQNLAEQIAKINAAKRIKSIPTTREREEMKKPTTEKFQKFWDSLINYNETHTTMSFYPVKQRIGPRAIFFPEAAPIDIYNYFVHGLLDTLYIGGEDPKETQKFPSRAQNINLKELQEFPISVRKTIKSYSEVFAKERPLFLKTCSSYPIFGGDQELLVPSITIAQLGISNGEPPDRDEIPATTPSKDHLVTALAGVFFESLRLGTGRGQSQKIKINYCSDNLLIYSKFTERISEQQQEVIAKFEEPFEKFTGLLAALPDDYKMSLCRHFSKIPRHSCEYCSDSQMEE